MIIYILGYVYRKGNNMTEIKANYSVGDKPEKKLTT